MLPKTFPFKWSVRYKVTSCRAYNEKKSRARYTTNKDIIHSLLFIITISLQEKKNYLSLKCSSTALKFALVLSKKQKYMGLHMAEVSTSGLNLFWSSQTLVILHRRRVCTDSICKFTSYVSAVFKGTTNAVLSKWVEPHNIKSMNKYSGYVQLSLKISWLVISKLCMW